MSAKDKLMISMVIIVAICLFLLAFFISAYFLTGQGIDDPSVSLRPDETADWTGAVINFEIEGKKNAFYAEFWEPGVEGNLTLDYVPEYGFEIWVDTDNIRNLSIDLPAFYAQVKGDITPDGINETEQEYREHLVQSNYPIIAHLGVNNGSTGIEELVFHNIEAPDYVEIIRNGRVEEFTDYEYIGDSIYTNIPEGTTYVYIYYNAEIRTGSTLLGPIDAFFPYIALILAITLVLWLLVTRQPQDSFEDDNVIRELDDVGRYL